MIQTLSDITSDRALKQWIDRFFTHVESKRKSRGLELYNKRAVKDFQDKIFGFTATVKGGKDYNVSAFFDGVNKAGLPLLDNALFICSCPDDEVFCKHTIAAVIHWAVNMDWKKQAAQKDHSRKQLLLHQRPGLGANLKKLEQLAKKEAPVSFAKDNALDWVFNPPIDEVMKSILKKGV